MKMRKGFSILTLLVFVLYIMACSKEECKTTPPLGEYDPTPYELVLPATLTQTPIIPEDNPLTVKGVALGRMLFYDPILSGDNSLACAGCHQQSVGFIDAGRALSLGIDGQAGTRNSMSLVNLVFSEHFTWDGMASSLEEQALGPVPNPIEMHLSWEEAVIKLQNHSEYPTRFYEAFGEEEISKELVTKSLAQFIRTLVSGNSTFEQMITQGSGVFITEIVAAGRAIFFSETGECFHCHGNLDTFSDDEFHNNGLDAAISFDDFADKGRGKVTGNPEDNGKFKTPTLRNISATGPYMHDGRFNTLREVIDHYSEGIQPSPTLDDIILAKFPNGVQLSEGQKDTLEAFLLSLTDESFLTNPDHSNPFE